MYTRIEFGNLKGINSFTSSRRDNIKIEEKQCRGVDWIDPSQNWVQHDNENLVSIKDIQFIWQAYHILSEKSCALSYINLILSLNEMNCII